MEYECLENHDNIRIEFIIMKLHVLNLNLHIHFTRMLQLKTNIWCRQEVSAKGYLKASLVEIHFYLVLISLRGV